MEVRGGTGMLYHCTVTSRYVDNCSFPMQELILGCLHLKIRCSFLKIDFNFLSKSSCVKH